MTFNVGHVEGGTGAGRKRALKAKPRAWVHLCHGERRDCPGYMVRCTDCGCRRP